MTSVSPSSTEFGSRGSPYTFSDNDFGFALVDRVRLETLAVYFGDHDFNFTLVDRVRLEGLAFYFGDDDFGFALIDRVRLKGLAVYLRRWRLRPSPSSIQSDWRGSPSTFGDDYFGFLTHRYSSTRGARRPPSATIASTFALVNTVRLEGLAIHLWRRLLRPSPSSI